MKRFFAFTLCFALIVLAGVVHATQQEESIVAVVNDEVITVEQFLARVLPKYTDISRTMQDIDPLFAEILLESEHGEKLFEEYERRVLEDMVDRLLLIQYAREIGIGADWQFIREQIDKSIHDTLEELEISYGEANAYYMLRGYIGGLETYADVVVWDLIYSDVRSKLQARVIQDVSVSDEEILQYYEENSDRFVAEAEKVRLKIMTFRTFSEAYEKWRTASRHPEPIKVFSESEGGYIERDFSLEDIRELNPDLVRLVFRETSGELVQSVVPFGDGYAIIYMVAYTPARMLTLEEATKEITAEILPLKRQTAWEEWKERVFEEFKENSLIEIYPVGE
ncbi:MAG TPA: hypothetical protein DCE14_02715 [Kosmotogaceae bacterium]|nr:hypothetical protein [Kosmotogaceae bacterium]